MKPKLLIVDDDEEIRTQIKWALSEDYEVVVSGDRNEAVRSFREKQPAATLLDLGLPPQPNDTTEGLATLDELLSINPVAKVIILSGQSEKQNAIEAVGGGAYDFLCKPIEMDELKLLLRRCIYVVQLEQEYQELRKNTPSNSFEQLIGSSAQMEAMFAQIRKVAVTDASVLLLGESGTGKEVAALAIHQRSPRKEKPFNVGFNQMRPLWAETRAARLCSAAHRTRPESSHRSLPAMLV